MSTSQPAPLPGRFRAGAGFLVLLVIYEWCFGRFFPNAAGNLGHDYSYTLPELLAGDYWFHVNGWLAVPWFTPAFCGGKPYFADPQSMYYSLAQWLSFTMDPLHAIHASLLILASAGFWGCWWLLRRSFAASPPAAFLAATVFMFNGFYATRMIVGHYAFHSLMLVPLLAALLIGVQSAPAPASADQPGTPPWAGFWRWRAADAAAALGAGLILAYMIQSGLGTLLVVAVLSVLLLVVLGLRSRRVHSLRGFGYRSSAALALALAISAARLVANFSLLGHFPRSDYLLPGFDSLLDTLVLGFKMLFIGPLDIAEQSAAALRNVQWMQGRHEMEYGVTLVPLLALAVLLWRAWRDWKPAPLGPDAARAGERRRLQWLGLALLGLLSLPIVFNVFDPDWNAMLKSLPLIGSSSTLLRWFALYIPLLAVISGFAVDALPASARLRAGVVGAAAVALLTLFHDTSAYQGEPYPPRRILQGAAALHQQGLVPTIRGIGVYRNKTGGILAPLWRDDSMVEGASQMLCYYPTFGYNLEHMPMHDLQPGNADTVLGGDHYNLKNPACYVYPAENACLPGDHFRVDQKQAAADFVNYRVWQFTPSRLQELANALSLAALVAAGAALVALGLQRRR